MDEELEEGATNINETYNKWFEGITRILDHYMPPQVVTIKPNDKPWMNCKIRLAIRNMQIFLIPFLSAVTRRFPLNFSISTFETPLFPSR